MIKKIESNRIESFIAASKNSLTNREFKQFKFNKTFRD